MALQLNGRARGGVSGFSSKEVTVMDKMRVRFPPPLPFNYIIFENNKIYQTWLQVRILSRLPYINSQPVIPCNCRNFLVDTASYLCYTTLMKEQDIDKWIANDITQWFCDKDNCREILSTYKLCPIHNKKKQFNIILQY